MCIIHILNIGEMHSAKTNKLNLHWLTILSSIDILQEYKFIDVMI